MTYTIAVLLFIGIVAGLGLDAQLKFLPPKNFLLAVFFVAVLLFTVAAIHAEKRPAPNVPPSKEIKNVRTIRI